MSHRKETGITKPRDILSRFFRLSKIAVIRGRRRFHRDFQQAPVTRRKPERAWGSIKDKS
jgi:hypothetical protein